MNTRKSELETAWRNALAAFEANRNESTYAAMIAARDAMVDADYSRKALRFLSRGKRI